MTPYANDAEVEHVGDLSFENGADAIVVSGDLEIARDARGLADARALRDLADRIVRRLEEESNLPERLSAATRSTTIFPNPFGDDA